MNLPQNRMLARRSFARRVAVACLSAAFAMWTHLAAQPVSATDEATIIREDSVAQICDLLRSLPYWPALPDHGTEEEIASVNAEADELERIVEEVAAFDTDSLREAVVRYHAEIHSVRRTRAVEEHLILLNRYLFNLPERVTRSSPHFAMLCNGGNLKGWWRQFEDTYLALDSEGLAPRLPWYEDFDGRWRFWLLPAPPLLVYYGPPYAAVEVFDYSLREFGRRAIDVQSSVEE